MTDLKKEIFEILSQIAKYHLDSVPKVVYKGRSYDFYFLRDIANFYFKLSGKKLDQNWILQNFHSTENPFAVIPNNLPNCSEFSIFLKNSNPLNCNLAYEMMNLFKSELNNQRSVSGSPFENGQRPASGNTFENNQRPASGNTFENNQRLANPIPLENNQRPASGSPFENNQGPTNPNPLENSQRSVSGNPFENNQGPTSANPFENIQRPTNPNSLENSQIFDTETMKKNENSDFKISNDNCVNQKIKNDREDDLDPWNLKEPPVKKSLSSHFKTPQTVLNPNLRNLKEPSVKQPLNSHFKSPLTISEQSLQPGNKPKKVKLAFHCDFSDSDDQALISQFKSPLAVNEQNHPTDKLSVIKSKLISTFDDYPVISMDNFQNAFCAKHSVMFNHSLYPCPIPYHPHGNLSKFLGCFNEILELKSIRRMYILNKTPRIKDIVTSRFNSFVRRENDPLYVLGIEALLTSIFTTCTTLRLEDFVELFEIIYKNPISVLCSTTPVPQFISSLKSPNLTIVKKNEIYNLTVNPLRSESFVEWKPSEFHKKIMEIELSLLNKNEISEVKEEFLIFKEECPSSLLTIANLNVPRCVQFKISADTLNFDFDNSWIFLNSNLNFGNTRTFFI